MGIKKMPMNGWRSKRSRRLIWALRGRHIRMRICDDQMKQSDIRHENTTVKVIFHA